MTIWFASTCASAWSASKSPSRSMFWFTNVCVSEINVWLSPNTSGPLMSSMSSSPNVIDPDGKLKPKSRKTVFVSNIRRSSDSQA